MENFPLGIAGAECEFYGDRPILLEGAIEEFLSCLHMILSLPLRFLEEPPEHPVWLEVQLRTIAMDCRASIEHQLKYKQDIANQAMTANELKRCADEIASTDLSLQTTRELIETSIERKEAI